jgi:hypothetical protein
MNSTSQHKRFDRDPHQLERQDPDPHQTKKAGSGSKSALKRRGSATAVVELKVKVGILLENVLETLPPGGLLQVPHSSSGGGGQHLPAQPHLTSGRIPSIVLHLQRVNEYTCEVQRIQVT